MKHRRLASIVIACTLVLTVTLTLAKGDLSSVTDLESLGKSLGFITLIPTLLAVALAFITNKVVFSLLVGFLSGVLILTLTSTTSLIGYPINFVKYAFDSIYTVVFDFENFEILLLCFVVGGMVEVVKSSGGFEALAIKLTEKVNTPRKAGLIGSLLGCLIFFDDYANALIVGPIMKPITDRVKVSREKLSYIVDSTAAPITGIAIVSSWVAVEISSIEQGLSFVNMNQSGFSLFLRSVPFCFYCIFALTFIFLNALSGREFGPMLKAEQRARKGESVSKKSAELENQNDSIIKDKLGKRIFTGLGGIILLVVLAMLFFYIYGRKAAIASGLLNTDSAFTLNNVMIAVSNAKTTRLIINASLIGAIFTIIFGKIFNLFTIKQALKFWLDGGKKLLPTIVLLLLAWSLANVVKLIGTTYYAVEIISMNVPWFLVPALIFLCCCLISFASGSYGCLFVVMPLAIPLAYRIISMGVTNNNEIYLLICIGSVMAGSIFGDHCSPITDCTILSALGSGCDTMEHVHTQMPYAICVGIISVCAILLTSVGLNVFVTWLIAIILQLLVLLLIGKKPI